jgi:hypothetical protein
MRKTFILPIILIIFWTGGTCLAEAPHQVGPFVLNKDIADYQDYVIMETALPIRHMENIEEVETKPIEGFKSGIIAYATCTAPGHIVRIKLKYTDSSKKFYDELLKRIKKRFGDPSDYRGDPFHIVVGWKWSFVDKENNHVSLTVQHNTMDEEEKKGNSIKLTMSNLIDKDRLCYKEKALDQREKLRQRKWGLMVPELKGWDRFLPR